jgi:hypothetical protein
LGKNISTRVISSGKNRNPRCPDVCHISGFAVIESNHTHATNWWAYWAIVSKCEPLLSLLVIPCSSWTFLYVFFLLRANTAGYKSLVTPTTQTILTLNFICLQLYLLAQLKIHHGHCYNSWGTFINTAVILPGTEWNLGCNVYMHSACGHHLQRARNQL